MNIEESCFERTYHKVQVPSELINSIRFRLNNWQFYIHIFFSIACLYGFYFEYISNKNSSGLVFLVFLFLIFGSALGDERENRKIISLMKNGYLTNGVVEQIKIMEHDSPIVYKIRFVYNDIDNDNYFIEGRTTESNLKLVDILYLIDNPKEAIILDKNFMPDRKNYNKIIELIKKYSTLIENKTPTT
ncbi:MAG TPA: hypothetical protein PKV76_03450 [Chitinophagales bacterium]|nr:hypothetical protein [Chitinophagales bacterium]